ncbi:MAG: aminopeptidase P family protein [Rhodospirillaceae bacterium]|nr:aminopeptidase P family protein [Rhodospirillaceae bacterium]
MSEDPNEMQSLSQKNRLTALRAHLKSVGVDGCVVPRGDEYQGEFVAPYAERLAWLTDFTGSAGLAVVLSEQAALFVDGRYTLQVRDQVDDTLYAIRHVTDEPVSAWLKESLTNGQKLGFDPHLHTPGQVKRFCDACEKAGAALVQLSANPIDAVWQDQPARPQVPAKTHPLEIAGQSHEDKRKRIAETLHKDGYDAILVTASDSLCWLFNIRGADVENTPLVLASALLFADGEAVLFMDSAKVTDDVRDHLGTDVGITGVDGLGAVIDDLDDAISTVAVDKATVSQWAVDRLETAGLKAIQIEDPCSLPKACKNNTEVKGVRAAHVRDGAALTNFLAWLDQEVVKGNLTEVSAAERLEQFRRSSNLFQGPSFPTISGAGANSAIVHYRATAETDSAITGDMLYLVDSGGQYLDGTTDVTRTIAIGTPTAEQKRRFTQVLKGHIALATARFPEGTSGGQLDGFARAALWADGVDYDHGTGHGVGAYLGVHEGPQRIGKAGAGPALKPGMVVSNEPGYYKAGGYGIRIENLVVVQEADAPVDAEKPLLEFETITLAPIDLRLVDNTLLTGSEKAWLNAYHARVRETLKALVAEETANWLAEATQAL